ncbi:hypothetical protein FA95DRAFT_1607995 [Auriscalpium vulgare]|uniref:Uncharacterized protein n=1 Tax=Auriscalpium vulgare TaxID=40419 RepID=A0ACB8RNH9_9AGAM|nr:hypothetical protein FA95DRAFT_1607995 [Auriscalpium vulgare]
MLAQVTPGDSSHGGEHDAMLLESATSHREAGQSSPNKDILDSVSPMERALLDTETVPCTEHLSEEAAVDHPREDFCNETADARLARHQQHNANLPVTRLPPEILAIVFTHLSNINHPQLHCTVDYERFCRLGWVAVTHVCMRWRQVALQCPRLWADINLEFGQEWTATFHARAGNTLLSVDYLGDSFRLAGWQVEFLVDNISRTHGLRGRASPEVLTAVTAPAPLLHTLDLEAVRLDEDDAEALAAFLGGGAPSLRHVSLSSDDADLPLTSPLLRGLVSLNLRFAEYPESVPLNDVLDVLERIPTLERLELRMYMEDYEVDELELGQLRMVVHAKLAYLDIAARARVAELLLSHLMLPPQAVVRCNLTDVTLPERPGAFFSAALASVHSHADSASNGCNAITNVEIALDSQCRCVRISARKGDDAPSEPVLSFLIIHLDRSGVHALVEMALVMFSSVHLKELAVDHSDLEDSAWLDLVGDAPRLRRITVNGEAAASLCAVLRLGDTIGDAPPLQPRSQPFLPVLSSLVLARVRLTIDEAGEMSDEDVYLSNALLLCLMERADAGYPLEELDVVQCNVDGAWVVKARQALPRMQVMWDEGVRERMRGHGDQRLAWEKRFEWESESEEDDGDGGEGE